MSVSEDGFQWEVIHTYGNADGISRPSQTALCANGISVPD